MQLRRAQRPRASERTIAVLMDRGLIQRNTRRVHFGDGLPPAEAFSYSIPYEHHIRWCGALGLARTAWSEPAGGNRNAL